MSQDCVFCKIVRGELPSARVFEDQDALVFMDINPVVKGHALVIPKAHHDPLTHIPTDLLQKLIAVVQRVARAQVAGLQADGINVSQANGLTAGQIVPHLHFHVIPRFATDSKHRNWTPNTYDSPQEIQAYAQRIQSAFR